MRERLRLSFRAPSCADDERLLERDLERLRGGDCGPLSIAPRALSVVPSSGTVPVAGIDLDLDLERDRRPCDRARDLDRDRDLDLVRDFDLLRDLDRRFGDVLAVL